MLSCKTALFLSLSFFVSLSVSLSFFPSQALGQCFWYGCDLASWVTLIRTDLYQSVINTISVPGGLENMATILMTSKYKRHQLNPCQHRVLFFSYCFSWIIHSGVCLIHFFICEGSNEALLCVCSGQWSNLVLIFFFWDSAFVFHKLSRHSQGHSKDRINTKRRANCG